MKGRFSAVFLSLLAPSVVLAGEGYKQECQLVELLKVSRDAKQGDVFKVRQFRRENQGGETFQTVALWAYRRNDEHEIKLKVTPEQWLNLQFAQAIFLRKGASGWEYLGYRVSRNPDGSVGYR